MNIYIWNRADYATPNYHNEGGIVVIAGSLELARQLIARECPKTCSALIIEPDLVRGCEGEEYIAIHRDAGCC